MSNFSSKRKRQYGAALVELAICLPIMLLTVSGLANLGSTLRLANVITESSRYGARAAVSYFTGDNSSAAIEALSTKARQAANRYLQDELGSRYNAADWTVELTVGRRPYAVSPASGNTTTTIDFYAASVRVTRQNSGLLNLFNLMSGISPTGESTFSLGICTSAC